MPRSDRSRRSCREPFKFFALPVELRLLILTKCNFRSLLDARPVSRSFKKLIDYELSHRKRLDIGVDYIHTEALFSPVGSNKLAIRKVITFLENYMKNLQELIIEGVSCHITEVNFIQLAIAVPNLKLLQMHKFYDRLPYEQEIEIAVLYEPWRLSTIETIVERLHACKLVTQEERENAVNRMNAARFKDEIKVSRKPTFNLTQISFDLNGCLINFSETLVWFLEFQPATLRSVYISHASFATVELLERFYSAILGQSYLEELNLVNCTSREEFDSPIHRSFFESLSQKGVRTKIL